MQNLADIVLANPMAAPSAPALADAHERIDYATLAARIRALAQFLTQLVTQHPAQNPAPDATRVAVLLPDCCAFIEVLLGCAAAGSLCVPLNTRLLAEEQCEILQDAEPSILFVHARYADRIAVLRAGLPTLRTVVLVGAADVDGAVGPDMLDYAVLRQAGAGRMQQAPLPAVSAQTDVLMLYTSGTTSRAKGAPLTHANVLANLQQYQAAVCLAPGGVNLQLSPMFHAAGIFCLVHLMRGGLTVFVPRVDPVFILDAIARERVTFMFTVPTVLYQLLDHPTRADADFSTLQHVQYGAAPITGTRLAQAVAVFGARLMHSYGMTETTSHVSILGGQDHVRKSGSVGRALPGIALRIVDGDGRDVATGEAGEVLVRGANVFAGYWRRPRETREVFRDGWLCTGDIGRMDDEGFLTIIDRKKDMIISGGTNIYPVDIEDALTRHPSIAEAAVFGVADAVWGEAVAAAIVLRAGTAFDQDALEAHLRRSLAGYKIPRRWRVLDALPKNASGKILKRTLRAQFFS